MEVKRRGSLVMPKNPYNLSFRCKVGGPMHEKNGKYYMDLLLPDITAARIRRVHEDMRKFLTKDSLWDPMSGNRLRVKVPYRYNRVTCKVSGRKVLQELDTNDFINATVEFCGVWEMSEWCGLSWKFTLVET